MAASSNCSSRQATLPPLTPCVWMFSRTPKKFVFCLLVVPLNQFGKHGIQYFNEQPSIPRLAAASDTMLEQPSSLSPCAPEGGTDKTGNAPNPGTNVGASASPGEDCTDVGPQPNGPYTLANPFPTYVGASWCGNRGEWRIQFYNYYVHDGILSEAGHRHDWEGIVVKWKKDPEGDWWHRAGAIYNKHCMHDHYTWDQLNTVDVDVPGTSDITNESTGLNRKHPKVYVGFFSHASFPEINKSRKTIFNGECPKYSDLLGNEYRSNDWWRMPLAENIRPVSDIHADWDYGDASSTPPANAKNMCEW
ncbi:hypothetical protein XPA_010423 [Xanthoria parietina]